MNETTIQITCISDLHGDEPTLLGGNILIVAGDLTISHRKEQFCRIFDYIESTPYHHKILIAGNHDDLIQKGEVNVPDGIIYLEDSGIELFGLKIWGSPWVNRFEHMNPRAAAFAGSESFLAEKFAKIPLDTDILITHSPPYRILDSVGADYGACYGSISLYERLQEVVPHLHVFGHIHDAGGKTVILKSMLRPDGRDTLCINASIMDQIYQPTNSPVYVNYEKDNIGHLKCRLKTFTKPPEKGA